MTKLAIVEEREEDKYEHFTTVKCWICDSSKGSEIPNATSDPKVRLILHIYAGIALKYVQDLYICECGHAIYVIGASI